MFRGLTDYTVEISLLKKPCPSPYLIFRLSQAALLFLLLNFPWL